MTPSPIISPRAATPQSPLPKNERKASKKAKAKEKKAGKDELDKALAELSVKCVLSSRIDQQRLRYTQIPRASKYLHGDVDYTCIEHYTSFITRRFTSSSR